MPTYTNSTDSTFMVNNRSKLEPNSSTELGHYVYPLPTGVTLTDHAPTISPWMLVVDVASVPMANPVDVTEYDNLSVFNASDDTVSLSANEDDSNCLYVAPNTKELFDNTSRIIGCLEVLAMGSGNVYIHGVK